jgi:predicted RND superfamily exporter protein
VISTVLTIAWAKFAVGGFNLITSFLPALVLGLGIDYGIHLISRYAEERQKGTSFNRALYTAIIRKGDASLAAALTTALVFMGLLTSRSRALFEMGAITGVGVLISFAMTILLIPTLLTLVHFLFRFHHRERVINYAPRFAPYFRFVSGKGRAIFTIVCILTFFISFQAAHVQFRFASADLVPHTRSQEVLSEILDKFGAEGAKSGDYFTFFAKNEDELENIVAHLSKSDLVESIDSARDLLPVNLSEQQQVLKSLNIPAYINQLSLLDKSITTRNETSVRIRTLLAQFSLLQYIAALNGEERIANESREIQLELRQVQKRLSALDVRTAHARIAALEDALSTLDQNLRQIRDLPPIGTLLRDILDGLPAGIRSRYLTADGEYIIRARMSPAIYEPENLRRFNSYAASFSDHYFGMPLVTAELERYMRHDFFLSTILAAVLIGLTLWRSMGGVRRAILAGSPLVLGYLWMLAGMRLLGFSFNFINITISPLLIGIGVDNGIHMLHRYLEERALDPEGAIERGGQRTALAVIVTSLTTMLVFGSLLLARTPGLRFLGDSALLGIGFTLLFSLLFLPAALRVFGKRV